MKLIKKHFFRGTIELKTGLHIGGAKSSLDIGGLDSPVIKTAKGVPYIPGSSLKGKIRSLLAMQEGAKEIGEESDKLLRLFGCSDAGKEQKTRLIFRDALLDIDKFEEKFKNSELLATKYTEEKFENTIDRLSGKTKGGLRSIERVPAGAVFNFEIVLDEYDSDNIEENKKIMKEAFQLLENDYIGGSGTRGYGHVGIVIDKEEELKIG
jgi:CRISPR-associated RAMP protein, csm3 family